MGEHKSERAAGVAVRLRFQVATAGRACCTCVWAPLEAQLIRKEGGRHGERAFDWLGRSRNVATEFLLGA